MVRAPAHALPRPNGFALLKPASRSQLDSARILTMSGTLAINLIALGLLMMPLAAPPPTVWVEPQRDMTVRPIPKEPVIVEIVPNRKPTPRSTAKPVERHSVAPTHSETIATTVVTNTGSELATDSTASEDTGPTTESIEPVSMGPAPVQLEYALAPAPKYPRNAQRLGLTGTVLLQVLVGLDGRPLEVTVAQSSGHRELDEAARAQVLKRWSFQPATKNGQAVQAIGMVPVAFSLQR